MKRAVMLLIVLSFVVAAIPTGLFAAESKELVICDFGGAFSDVLRKVYYDPFEKETGIKVIDTTSPSVAKLKAMVQSGNVEWDVMLGAAGLTGTAIREGLLEKIDYRYFDRKTFNDLFPEAKKLYGVGTFYFSTVIAYRTDVFPTGQHPRSWKDVWDVKKFPGPRIMHSMEVGGDNWEYNLLADGVPMDKIYEEPTDWDRVFKKYDEIKPHTVKFWTQSAEAGQMLSDNEAVIGIGYNGRIQRLIDMGAPLAIDWNEGMLFLEYLMIPKGAPNYENACKFMAFQSRADRQAEFAKAFAYGPVNSKSFAEMSPERARLMPSYPENKKVQFMQDEDWYFKNMSDAITRWQKWTVK
jgi:putative spermidine/putrescine transport system substrate-binding protein